MADIKTRFVLEGESQFRSAMSQAASAVKTLNAEQKLAQAQFQATGDAESYMAAQTRILQSRLEAQQGAVQAAGQALLQIEQNGGKGSKTWDTWNMKLLNAQTAVAKTEAEIKNLGSSMDAAGTSTDGLETSLANVEKHTDFSAVIQGIDKITGAMEKAAKKAVQFGKKIYSAEVDASVWADDLITQSTAYGIDTETLQRWEYAAQFVDTEVGTILKARDRLIKSSQSKTGYGIMEELGIDSEGLSTMDLFWETLNKLQDAGDNQEKWSQELFSKSFRDLMPLLQAGREEWEKWAEEAPVVSEASVKNLGEANDAFNKMNSTLETTKIEMLSALAPAFTDLANALTTFVNSDEGQQAISDITNMLTNGMKWLIDNKGDVINTVTALGAAFAGLKVSGGVLTFMNSLNGLKNLFGGGAAGAGAAGAGAAGSAATGTVAKAAGATLPAGLELLGGIGLGVGGAFMLTGGVAAGLAKLIYKEENDINKTTRVKNAAYSQEDYDALSEWIDISNKISQNMLTMTEQEYIDLEARRGEIMGQYGNGYNELFNKYFDYLTANDLDSAVGDILPKLEEMGLEAPVTLDPDTEGLQAELSGTPFSASVVLNPQFPGMAQGMLQGFPHANGIWSVPWDGYPAILHRGERVVPANQTRSYSSNLYVETMNMNNGMDAQALADAIAASGKARMAGFGS